MVAVPFAINFVANLLFMPIFSGLKSVPLAAVVGFEDRSRIQARKFDFFEQIVKIADQTAPHRGIRCRTRRRRGSRQWRPVQ